MTEFDMTAKTFKGLEEVLATELIQLGANNVQIQRRAVSFSGDKTLLYKANIHLRTASRILKPILVFEAPNADAVYDKLKNYQWENHMNVNTTFAIDSTVFSEDFKHSKYLTYRVKDAIVDYFSEKYDKRPSVRIDNPQLIFNIHVSHHTCTLSLDSSGESLHKRGYKKANTEAPINEALAAGMVLLSGWEGKSDFIDPMCGSGTILIEAGLIALNIPPGIYRKEFAFEKWKDFDEELFNKIYNDDSNERIFNYKIYGSDISPKAVGIAVENISNAGLSKYIEVKIQSVQQLESPSKNCLMITNPPYGERIKPSDLYAIYSSLGKTLKHKFIGNSAWIISSDENALFKIGLKPSTKIPLLNGALDCLFCKYDIFPGKRNDFLAKRSFQNDKKKEY